jgi:twitching motility two-component system response regulator PilG
VSAGKRVVVIDSDSGACGLIAETLGPRGFEVYPFADPDEGVAKAGEIRPDLVFISILFSGTNGLRVSRAVHSVEGLQRVPVIMLISCPDEVDLRYTSTMGIVDTAVKPLNAEEILSKALAVVGEGVAPDATEEELLEVPVREEAASLVGEWMMLLDEGDRETEEVLPEVQPVHEAEEDHAAEVFETEDAIAWRAEDDTEDFLSAEELGEPEPTDEDDHPEFVARTQRGPMKRFFFVAAAVFVLVVGAGVGAYLFFQGQGSKIATPVARVPLKKAQAVTKAVMVSPSALQTGAGEAAKEAARAQKETCSIQVGAFRNQENAAALIEKLKKKGYDAFILNEPGRAMRRVLIGKFGSREEAVAQARLIFEREGLKSIILRY